MYEKQVISEWGRISCNILSSASTCFWHISQRLPDQKRQWWSGTSGWRYKGQISLSEKLLKCGYPQSNSVWGRTFPLPLQSLTLIFTSQGPLEHMLRPKNGPASPMLPSFSSMTHGNPQFSFMWGAPRLLGLDLSHHFPMECLLGKVTSSHHEHGSCGIRSRKTLGDRAVWTTAAGRPSEGCRILAGAVPSLSTALCSLDPGDWELLTSRSYCWQDSRELRTHSVLVRALPAFIQMMSQPHGQGC